MPRSHTDLEAVVIGLFPRASDARRALNVLREHHFSADEAAAAFREPAPRAVETEQASVPVRGSAQLVRTIETDLPRRRSHRKYPARAGRHAARRRLI